MEPSSTRTGYFCHSQPRHILQDSFERNQVAFFSRDERKLTVDQSQLKPYQIPHQRLNVHPGNSNYIPRVFTKKSQISDLLTVLSILHKDGQIDLCGYELICQSNFFQYCALLKQSEYYALKVKNKLIIVNTDTRQDQNPFMSYIGIHFENLITEGPNCQTRSNNSSFNSIVQTQINGMKCLYTCEIDSYDPFISKANTVPDIAYTEIKLVLSKKIPTSNMKNSEILKLLRKGNTSFEDFLYRVLIQCRFGNNHQVLIGIRDNSFNVRLVRLFSVKELDQCFKSIRNPNPPGLQYKFAVGGYDGYVRSVDYIEGILSLIKAKLNTSTSICKVRIRTNEIDIAPVKTEEERQSISKFVLNKDFLACL